MTPCTTEPPLCGTRALLNFNIEIMNFHTHVTIYKSAISTDGRHKMTYQRAGLIASDRSLAPDLCISNPGRLIPPLPGSIRPRKRFSRLFSVELLILPNTDIHHRGLRGLNWKLPTSEINLNRLAVGIVISVPMLNGSQFYPASKSYGEPELRTLCLLYYIF